MEKKKRLKELKPGQKFRYKRKLYLLDDLYCAVHINTGKVASDKALTRDVLVTPVKVSIKVK